MLSSGTDGYSWDARNHLVSTPSGASFQYDTLGRRVASTFGATTTNYLYDGVNVVQEIQNATPANLLAGLRVDEIFTRTDASGTAAHFLTDALGSTVALADATGTIETQYTYEPFGNTAVSGQPTANPFQYSGRENDATGLYFHRARYYSPTFQRFTAEDPIGFAGGFNLYAYVQDNPISFNDPSGTQGGVVIVAPIARWIGASILAYLLYLLLKKGAPPVPPPKPKEKCGRVAKCDLIRYDKQLRGCLYYCDDGMWWFTSGPCETPIYKPWGDGFPGGLPDIPLAP